MMNAYNELYLSDAKLNLGQCMSYLIDDCDLEPSEAADYFVASGFAELFEKGDPWVISGMSGTELAERIMWKIYGNKESRIPSHGVRESLFAYESARTPVYWAGWVIAEYQWYTGRRFKDIFSRISLEKVISMYELFHQIDIAHFIYSMNEMFNNATLVRDTKLKTIRESREISQVELSQFSGVKLRSIQMYEQRKNDIDKAQAQTLYKLSRVLGCNVEDLLEDPSV